MYIYNAKTKKYLSKTLTASGKNSACDLTLIENGNEFQFKNEKNLYLTYSPNNSGLNIEFSKNKTSNFSMYRNKYIYTVYNGTIYILTFIGDNIFLSSDQNLSIELQAIELIRKSGICSKSFFHGNKYRGIITDLYYKIPVNILNDVLENGMIYNQEDRAKNDKNARRNENLVNRYTGENEVNILNLCEPCVDISKQHEICKSALGVVFSVGMYDRKQLPDCNENHCILHFSPLLLEDNYYHLNTRPNNGFIIRHGEDKTYTDDNIKDLTKNKCEYIRNGKYYFQNFELIVRNSVNLDYLRHITFFNLEKHIQFRNSQGVTSSYRNTSR